MTNTAYELLDRRASCHPDRAAFGFLHQPSARSLTYAQLRQRALAIGAQLADRCAPGDRVLLLLDTGPEFIATLFGCFYAGVVAVAAAATAGSREALARNIGIAADCTPRCLVRDAAHADAGEAILAGAGLTSIARLDPSATGEADLRPVSPPTPDCLAVLQYTSGSTRRPRGVRLTHRCLLHNARAVGLAFDLDEGSIGVGWLPLSHDMGLVGNVLVPMYWNFPVHLLSPSVMLRRPATWLRAISDCRGTISGGPGFAYDLAVDRISEDELQTLDLSTWRVAYVGGEPVSPTTLRRFGDRFEGHGFTRHAFVPCYGLAESTLFVAGRRVDAPPAVVSSHRAHLVGGLSCDSVDPAAGLHTVGHRLPPPDAHIDIRIVHEGNGRVLPEREVGEICVGSASIGDGYFSEPITTTADGLLRTGDAGFIADGELHVLGRLTDAVTVAPGRIFAHAIETAVRSLHPALAESAAFAVPGQDGDEVVIVQGVRGDEHAMDQRRLIAAATQAVADQFSLGLRTIVFVPARRIRRTTSGKVQRRAIRDAYLAGEFDAGNMRDAAYTTASTVFERV